MEGGGAWERRKGEEVAHRLRECCRAINKDVNHLNKKVRKALEDLLYAAEFPDRAAADRTNRMVARIIICQLYKGHRTWEHSLLTYEDWRIKAVVAALEKSLDYRGNQLPEARPLTVVPSGPAAPVVVERKPDWGWARERFAARGVKVEAAAPEPDDTPPAADPVTPAGEEVLLLPAPEEPPALGGTVGDDFYV